MLKGNQKSYEALNMILYLFYLFILQVTHDTQGVENVLSKFKVHTQIPGPNKI